jgi:uncharacterized protein (DUF2267 family)
MQYNDFISDVVRAGGLDSFRGAERVVGACLQTLGEIMPASERNMLAAQLPKALRETLTRRNTPREAPLEEFYHTVGARADLGHPEAVRQSLAVIQTLTRAVSPEQWKEARAALPPEYAELFGGKGPGASSPTREGLSKAEQGPAPVGPASGAELLDYLKAEDVEVQRMLEKLRDTSLTEAGEREVLVEEVRGRVLSRNRALEERLFPYLEMVANADRIRERSLQENRRIEGRLEELQQLPKDDDRFECRVEALIGAVSEHVSRERAELFPEAQSAISGR